MRGDASIPVMFAAVATIAVLSFAVMAPSTALISTALGCAMLAIALVDARHFLIPDTISLPSLVAGLVAVGFLADPETRGLAVLAHAAAAVFGAAVLYAIAVAYRYWRQNEGSGFGDVKLAAVAGAWTGPEGLGSALLVACLAAFGAVLFTHRGDLQSLQRTTAIPFGTFLAPSIWLIWFTTQAGFEIALPRF